MKNNDKMFFINGSGHDILNDKPNDFSQHFDWILTRTKLFKKKKDPQIIYCKIDFLPYFASQILPRLFKKFVLVSSCSDYSPQVNFKKEYDAIIENPLLLRWYTNNKYENHPKLKSLPGGLCHYTKEDENILLQHRQNLGNIIKKNKILCIWRKRDFNVCGDEYITRTQLESFILNRPEIFDWFEPNLELTEFYKIMAEYRYILCPVGNGLDPAPKSFEAIALQTIPIILKTPNTDEYYNDMPCILLDDFYKISSVDYLEKYYNVIRTKLQNVDYIYKLSSEYMIDKIKSEFNPLVSVIIPTYNRYDLLLQAIKSVADQTYRYIELIIIDDQSTDDKYNSLSVDIETKFPNMEYKIIRNEKNTRQLFGYPCAGFNRNIGIKESRGNFIAFCDDDDIWLPYKLTLQINAMIHHDMEICCTEGYYIEKPLIDTEIENYDFSKHQMYHGQKFYSFLLDAYNVTTIPKVFDFSFIEKQNFLSNSSVIISRRLYNSVGDIDTLPNGQEDYGYWKRCLKIVNCLYLHIPTIAYRVYTAKI